MRQIWIARKGPPEALELRESPDPVPGPGEVRIRIEAAGINFADILARLGLYPAIRPPAVPGLEVAGRVDAVGGGVPEEWVGKDVLAGVSSGGYADVVCTDHRATFERPPGMAAEEGAAIPVNYLTAYMALLVMGALKPHERVLVHSAGGGVGMATIDICRIHGATVYGTASAWKHEPLRERGLAAAIDYRNRDFEEEVRRLTDGRGVHIALDPIGGDSWRKSYRSLAPTGRLVVFGFSTAAPGKVRKLAAVARFAIRTPWLLLNPIRLIRDSRAVVGVYLGELGHERERVPDWMAELFRWYGEGKFRPHIDRRFPLSEAAEAHHYIQDRRNLGKVVLVP